MPDRTVRLREIDPAALCQPARTADRRAHPHRRREHLRARLRPRPGAHEDRHGVPALQPVSAPVRARQPHDRAVQGAQAIEGGSRAESAGRPRARRSAGEDSRVPRPSVRRSAAARSHRPRARHGSGDDAVRRGHLGARSRAGRRGPQRHALARRGRHDDDGGDPRDALRPAGGRPGRVHGRRRDRRAGPSRPGARAIRNRSARGGFCSGFRIADRWWHAAAFAPSNERLRLLVGEAIHGSGPWSRLPERRSPAQRTISTSPGFQVWSKNAWVGP